MPVQELAHPILNPAEDRRNTTFLAHEEVLCFFNEQSAERYKDFGVQLHVFWTLVPGMSDHF